MESKPRLRATPIEAHQEEGGEVTKSDQNRRRSGPLTGTDCLRGLGRQAWVHSTHF